MLHPLILLIWAAFALAVMSPLGYWVVRGARRLRSRRRLAALAPPPLMLQGEQGLGPEFEVAREALELRAGLRASLVEAEDYLAALPLLDVELHLSRALRFRTSWGLRMRERYEAAVDGAFARAQGWLKDVEALPEPARQELARLGANPQPIRSIVTAYRSHEDRVRNYGDGVQVRETRMTLSLLADAYVDFAGQVLGRAHDPYR